MNANRKIFASRIRQQASGRHHASVRHAFTFLEVLFSVIIMGIGFIMIAGMFPIAIQQSQQTVAESISQNIARDGIHYLQSVATNTNFPVTATGTSPNFVPQYLPVPMNITGNGVATSDPRFGFIAFYRRDMDPLTLLPSPSVQVIVLVAKQQTTGVQVYSHAPAFLNTSYFQGTLSTVTGGTLKLTASSAPWPVNSPPGPAIENAYAIVLSPPTTSGTTDLVGRVMRLGTNLYYNDPTNGYQWNLQPGAVDALNATATGFEVFVLGAPVDPSTGTFIGQAQDVAALSGVIHIDN